jgi:sugar lactone lactonase YvrE
MVFRYTLPLWIAAAAAFFFSNVSAFAATLLVSNWVTDTIDRIDNLGRRSVFASGLNEPRGLVFDGSGLLYVANSSADEILRFTPDGTRTVFATELLDGPRGLAFDEEGILFAANGVSNTVVKISPAGDVSLFASTNLSNPRGVAFDLDGNLFVANSGNNTLLQLAPDGTATVITSPLFNVPYGLLFDSAGSLYVSNFGSDSILKRNSDGTFSTYISTQLADPYGMVFDETGTLFVANLVTGIQKFSSTGSYIGLHTSATSPTFLVSMPVPEPGTSLSCFVAGVLLMSPRRARDSRTARRSFRR